MLPTPRRFSLIPAVVLKDTLTHMTVLSNERAFIFEDGDSYQLKIIPLGDIDSESERVKILDLTAKDGVLFFDFTFEGEQEYTAILLKDEQTIMTFSIFSLEKDLYELRPLRGDLHIHSCRSDGKIDPSALFGHYREMGYDFAALTDHHRYYPGGEIDEVFSGVDTGLTRVLGEEVHPGHSVHVVNAGGKFGIAHRYTDDPEKHAAEMEECFTRVPDSVPERFKRFYSGVIWATDAIHEAGGLAIYPHPYWKPNAKKCYHVCDELAKILLKSGMFDAYELLGGMDQTENNRSLALWTDLIREGYQIPVVGSSDVHNIEKSPYFPKLFTICFAKENDNDSIISAIKQGYSVAVESCGYEYDRQFRAYGTLRLVTYAQFLLKNYFPKIERIAVGAGVAMRAYAMGEADAAAISKNTEIAKNFSDTFLGKKSPKLPSEEILNFEKKWREAK